MIIIYLCNSYLPNASNKRPYHSFNIYLWGGVAGLRVHEDRFSHDGTDPGRVDMVPEGNAQLLDQVELKKVPLGWKTTYKVAGLFI